MTPTSGPSWRGSGESSANAGRSWRRLGRVSAPFGFRSAGWRALQTALWLVGATVTIATYVVLVFMPGCEHTSYSVVLPEPENPGMPSLNLSDEEQFVEKLKAVSIWNHDDSKLLARGAAANKQVQLIFVAAMTGQTATTKDGQELSGSDGQTADRIFIYTKDARPDDLGSALLLDGLLDYLSALPHEKLKLLVVDFARGPVDWRWGQFSQPWIGYGNDGSDLIGAINEERKSKGRRPVENLVIMTSAAPGEVSWESPLLNQSVFAHFLIHGLLRDADDIEVGGNGDRRVTLGELHQFVLSRTHRWVEEKRDLRGQHPQLLISPKLASSLKDKSITDVFGNPEDPRTLVPRLRKERLDPLLRSIDSLEIVWKKRDACGDEAKEQNPLAWRQVLEHIRRAERCWLSGQSEEKMQNHLDSANQALKILEQPFSHPDPQSEVFPDKEMDPETQLTEALKLYAPKSAEEKVKRESIVLRTAAESSSWQSYRSRLWAKKELDAADRDRRYAEDLLFIGGPEELKNSADRREKANENLKLRRKKVDEIDDLVNQHHRLLAELPELALWAANRFPTIKKKKPAADSNRARMIERYSELIVKEGARIRPAPYIEQKKVFNAFDELADLDELEKIDRDLLLLFELTRNLGDLIYQLDNGHDPEIRLGLANRSIVKTHLDPLIERLQNHIEKVAGNAPTPVAAGNSPGGQPQFYDWQYARNAVQWSGIKAPRRKQLFQQLLSDDQSLHEHPTKLAEPTSADCADWSGIDGSWQALWALQTLSLGTADEEMDKLWDDWKSCQTKQARLQSHLIAALGQSARKRFERRASIVKKASTKDSSLNTKEMPLEEVLQQLLDAELAARTMHGYDAVLLKLQGELNPVRQRLDFDRAALFTQQADRYLEDFWGSLCKDNKRWYQEVVDRCLREAARHSNIAKPSLVKRQVEVRKSLLAKEKAAWKIVSLPEREIDLGFLSRQTVKLKIEMNEFVPPANEAVAALWLEEFGDQQKCLAFEPGRMSVSQDSPKQEVLILKTKELGEDCAKIKVPLRLLFRSRFWNEDAQILVNPCRSETIKWKYFAPPDTGAIQVTGVDRRETILILDCSLSMKDPLRNGKNGQVRFSVAKDVLLQAMTELRKKTETYPIGLMACGHRLWGGESKRENPWNPDFPMVPGLIPENDFDFLERPFRLNLIDPLGKNQLQKISDYIDGKLGGPRPELQPWGTTPLLGAILEAVKYFGNKNIPGVIVAITDGDYTDEYPPGQALATPKLDQLKGVLKNTPGLSLFVVAFDADLKHQQVYNDLADITRGPLKRHPCTFKQVANGPNLAMAINKATEERHFKVIRTAEKEQELEKTVENLDPGAFRVRFADFPEMPVRIAGGEKIQFHLDLLEEKLKHVRPKYKEPAISRKEPGRHDNNPTRFGYLRAEHDKSKKTASFEFCLFKDGPDGFIERPEEIHIDIAPARFPKRRFSGSSELLKGQSFPAWAIELAGWPDGELPVVQAYWKMDRTKPSVELKFVELKATGVPLTLGQWPEDSLDLKVERLANELTVVLEAKPGIVASELPDIRVEVGRKSVEGTFQKSDVDYQSEYFEPIGKIIYKFMISKEVNSKDLWIGLTTPADMREDAVELSGPLNIQEFDR